jgi:tRNA-modifying protein YgfZ
LVKANLHEVGSEAADAWRVLLGIPRMGSDFGQDALPSEVGLEHTIDTAKGCFLGQESVARVRNLGHPPRILRRVRAEVAMQAGTPVVIGSTRVGSVTSVAPIEGGSVGFALVRWATDASALAQPDGTVLRVAD